MTFCINKLMKKAPLIMGIVNVTPDSFSDGGNFTQVDSALKHAISLAAQGAHILDIGGESTRPGANAVSEAEECDRVIPVIKAIRAKTNMPISIDTRKAVVAEAAIKAGATIWNDVSALQYDAAALDLAVKLRVPVILMHAKGSPKTMQDAPQYQDAVAEVKAFFADRVKAFLRAGGYQDYIILDPGIGFGKNLQHNLALTKNLKSLGQIGGHNFPMLYGASRKRLISEIDTHPEAQDTQNRLGGSLALHLNAAQNGANILRVHNVGELRQALAVQRALS